MKYKNKSHLTLIVILSMILICVAFAIYTYI